MPAINNLIYKNLYSFYDKVLNEYQEKSIQKSINIDDFLHNNLYENSFELIFEVKETSENNFILENKYREDNFSASHCRDSSGDKFMLTEKHKNILNFICDQNNISIGKIFDVSVFEVAKNQFFSYKLRFLKKNLKSSSQADKKLLVIKILASRFSYEVQNQMFGLENISKEQIISWVDNCEYFAKEINLKFQNKNKKGTEYYPTCENAFLGISKKIKENYPLFFQKTNNLSANKLKWHSDPHLFFAIFAVLLEKKYLRTANNSTDIKDIAPILQEFIKINKKIGDKSEYSASSFMQYLKPHNNSTKDNEVYDQFKLKISRLLDEFHKIK